ncbi:O-antigen ligase [uncultured Massilia sp.]|uniref:O-antigen ligase family protein n=1 Tax=uncultured Massilia sp. TaxID=169973 RepID=UPI0025E0C18C|nr:O-antigen ligase family protein [uncultured Massilia sp.]
MPFALLLCAALCANFILAGGHDIQRLTELGVFVLGSGLMLAQCHDLIRTSFGSPAGKAVALFFLLGAIGSVFAFSTAYAAFEVASLLMLYLLAVMAGRDIARLGTGALPPILRCIGVACAFQMLPFTVRYGASLAFGNAIDESDLATGFSNIRFFNHVQTATLPLLVLLCHIEPRKRLRWLWLAVAACWWMLLVATTGRGTLLGLAAACAAVVILLRGAAWPYLKTAASTAALGLLAYFVLLVALPAVAGIDGLSAFSYAAQRTAADPASGRLVLWGRAVELVARHPLLGVGPMHFAHGKGEPSQAAHPHDWLLQIGSEWGLPALACLVGALALGMRALLEARQHIAHADGTGRTIHAAMVAGAVAILVDGLVSGLFVMPASRIAIALYLGCALGWYRAVVPAAPSTPGRRERVAGAVLVALALAGTAAIWPEALARYRGEPLTAAQQAANPGVHWPRLWEAGFF